MKNIKLLPVIAAMLFVGLLAYVIVDRFFITEQDRTAQVEVVPAFSDEFVIFPGEDASESQKETADEIVELFDPNEDTEHPRTNFSTQTNLNKSKNSNPFRSSN